VAIGLGSIRVPACGVRRLAEQGFPAGRRKLHAGTRGGESRPASYAVSMRSPDALALPTFRKRPMVMPLTEALFSRR
jgi:hypothetical protein